MRDRVGRPDGDERLDEPGDDEPQGQATTMVTP
jgi:hypothetical protein